LYLFFAADDRPDFPPRTCLPHHNEIAVDTDLDDSGKIPKGRRLYQDPAVYADQFRLRMNAAIAHIRQLYAIWSA
jgi:hypothetical protein